MEELDYILPQLGQQCGLDCHKEQMKSKGVFLKYHPSNEVTWPLGCF